MIRLPWICSALFVFGMLVAAAARSYQDDDAAALRLAEPDFTLVALRRQLHACPRAPA